MQAWAQVLALAAGGVGSLALAGWLLKIPVLTAIVPDFIPMTVATAVGLVLAAGAIAGQARSRQWLTSLSGSSPAGTINRRAIPIAVILPVVIGWLRLKGRQEAFCGMEFGLALLATTNIVGFVGLIWWSTRLLNGVAGERQRLAGEREALQTSSRLAAIALADSSAKFKHLVQSVHDYAITMLDLDGRIVSWNAGAERLIGYTDDEIIGHHFSQFYPPEEIAAQKPQAILEQALAKGRYEDHALHVRKDGTRFWATVIINTTQDDRGIDNGFAKITRDITAWKEAQDELTASEERMRSIVHNVVDGIITMDESGLIQSLNPAAEKIFGYTSAELAGHNVKDMMPAPYQDEHDNYLHNYLTTGVGTIIGSGQEVAGRRKDGSTFPMELAIGEFHQGAVRLFTGVVRDITERKEVERLAAEQARRDQEALESRVEERTKQLSNANFALQVTVSELKESREQLRQLSKRFHSLQEKERSRIAHEIHDELGQMLAVMKIGLLRMKNRVAQVPAIAEQAKVLMDTVDQTIGTLRRISSDLRPIVLEQLGIGAALEWLVADITRRTGVVCDLDLNGDLAAAHGEIATGLFRITQEALTNALKHSGASKIDVRFERRPTSLTLTVRDHGRGIRAEDKGRSTSLGLTGMNERALAMGATLIVQAAPAGGTEVIVEVPLTEELAQ